MKKLCTAIIILAALISICSAEPDISIYLDGSRLDTETMGYFDGADYCIALGDNVTIMETGVLDISSLMGCGDGEISLALFDSPLVNIKDGIISFNLFPENFDDGSIRVLGYAFTYIKGEDGKLRSTIEDICLYKEDNCYYFTILDNKELNN